ncbi:unnamed protein product [Polarella glacialis]|uniref:TmcA/NAT10 N-terminal domain-containing protein n=1 Tax=Polarella glacialis TaxID=89957 RepID=A0A813K6H1_POLGL|nr:unnamed protein product [Polarella glacialis]
MLWSSSGVVPEQGLAEATGSSAAKLAKATQSLSALCPGAPLRAVPSDYTGYRCVCGFQILEVVGESAAAPSGLTYAVRDNFRAVPVEADFAAAVAPVRAAMPLLLEGLRGRAALLAGLRTCRFCCAWDGGHLEVLLTYDRPLGEAWPKEAEELRTAVPGLAAVEGRSKGAFLRSCCKGGAAAAAAASEEENPEQQPPAIPRAFPDSLVIRGRRLSFLRPDSDAPAASSAKAACSSAEWVVGRAELLAERLGRGAVVMELQCGFGLRTIVLGSSLGSAAVAVVALETDLRQLAAARQSCEQNGGVGGCVEFVEGGVAKAAELLQAEPGRFDALLLSSPRSGGLPEDMLGLACGGGFADLLYISGGQGSAAKDLPRLLAGGFEVDLLDIADPMPGTDHVEIRFHLHRRLDGAGSVAAMASLSALASQSSGKRPSSEWLCAGCENLVFRRHVARCPRCGGERDAEAEARLRAKAELATVLKAGQRAEGSGIHQLEHCTASGGSRDPMRHASAALRSFLAAEAPEAPSLKPYLATLAAHGLVDKSLAEEAAAAGGSAAVALGMGAGLPVPCSDRSLPRQLLLISAERPDWALQLVRETLASIRQKRAETGKRRWIWAGFERGMQGPPPPTASDLELGDGWEWVDVRRADALLGAECEVCVLVCMPHLHVDALGILSGLVIGGGLLVLVSADANDFSGGRGRKASQSSKASSASAGGATLRTHPSFPSGTPFDIRFGRLLLETCAHTELRHAVGLKVHAGTSTLPEDAAPLGHHLEAKSGDASVGSNQHRTSTNDMSSSIGANREDSCGDSCDGIINNTNGHTNNGNNDHDNLSSLNCITGQHVTSNANITSKTSTTSNTNNNTSNDPISHVHASGSSSDVVLGPASRSNKLEVVQSSVLLRCRTSDQVLGVCAVLEAVLQAKEQSPHSPTAPTALALLAARGRGKPLAKRPAVLQCGVKLAKVDKVLGRTGSRGGVIQVRVMFSCSLCLCLLFSSCCLLFLQVLRRCCCCCWKGWKVLLLLLFSSLFFLQVRVMFMTETAPELAGRSLIRNVTWLLFFFLLSLSLSLLLLLL